MEASRVRLGSTTDQMTPNDLESRLQGASNVQVLDVRREPEWEAGHIEGATWWPLDNFRVSPPEIDRTRRSPFTARVDIAA